MSEKGKKRNKTKQKKVKQDENTTESIKILKEKSKNKKLDDNVEKSVKFTEDTIDNEVEGNPIPKKKRKTQEPEEYAPLSEEMEAEIQKPENIKNVVSKRQQKREKYEKLLAEKQLISEIQMQQRVLSYLSLWKHNKQEWKFEKIKQIWLQAHMFDSARVPDEFWDTTLQYFAGSKGKIRKFLIDECTKIVDEIDKNEESEKTEEDETKYKRARELLQNLQE